MQEKDCLSFQNGCKDYGGIMFIKQRKMDS